MGRGEREPFLGCGEARTQNGSHVCVACWRVFLPPKNTVPHPFLGLGLFVGDSLSQGECLECNAGKNIKRRAKRKRKRDSFKHCC